MNQEHINHPDSIPYSSCFYCRSIEERAEKELPAHRVRLYRADLYGEIIDEPRSLFAAVYDKPVAKTSKPRTGLIRFDGPHYDDLSDEDRWVGAIKKLARS